MGLLSGLLGNAGVVAAEKLVEDYGQLLADGEQIEVGFQVIRDTFIFTNKRLIMVDVHQESKARVREIMNMGFPRVRFCGKDSTFINPFKSPRQIYPQTTH